MNMRMRRDVLAHAHIHFSFATPVAQTVSVRYSRKSWCVRFAEHKSFLMFLNAPQIIFSVTKWYTVINGGGYLYRGLFLMDFGNFFPRGLQESEINAKRRNTTTKIHAKLLNHANGFSSLCQIFMNSMVTYLYMACKRGRR